MSSPNRRVPSGTLDRYLSQSIRQEIEQRYYAKVNAQARLEHLIHDPEFLRDPASHTALFPDHGVVHVRNIAQQIVQVLDTINGVLIPARSGDRLEFMKAYGVMVAYVHDIGMADFSAFGRAMHPELASQAVFEPAFDDIVGAIWRENYHDPRKRPAPRPKGGAGGNVPGRLVDLANRGALEQDPTLVLREMLAMSNCHSKSKVPVEVLNDPSLLRRTMQEAVGTDLQVLYRKQQERETRNAKRPTGRKC